MFGKWILRAALCVVLSVAYQAAFAVDTTVDLTPVFMPILQGLGIVFLGVATWAVNRFLGKLKIDQESVVRQYVTEGLQQAAQYGMKVAKTKLAAAHIARVDVHNEAIAQALSYSAAHFPDGLKKLDLDPSTPTGQEKLRKLIMARLPD